MSQQREQLQALNNKLTEVQENERKQLAQELHDEMGQALTAISINLISLQSTLADRIAPALTDRLAESIALTDQALEQAREISFNLRPPMLDDLGLVPTLRWYVKRLGERMDLHTDFAATGMEQRLPPEIETTLYRVLQEALTNVARHAHAECVRLRLHCRSATVVAHIEDDGQGFDVSQALDRKTHPRGMGLLGMHERVTLLDGTFRVDSAPGASTRLVIEIPV